MHRGSCLCKTIQFEVTESLKSPDACHCSKCRKYSGHFFVSTDVTQSSLNIIGEEKIRWYQSSEKVKRGFCEICGSSLFWKPIRAEWIAIAMGAFDSPTNTHISKHIFVADKGDYYDIADGLPQNLH